MRQVLQPSVLSGPAFGAMSRSQASRFQTLQQIGQSPHAKVYTARDLETGAMVVVKVLDTQACKGYDRERMLNEAKYHGMVRHPNVITLFEHFEEGRLIYMVLEHAENGDLYHFLKKRGKELTEADRRKLMHQVCHAVGAVHSAGLIHRDIKPENIFVDAQLNAKLGDFGWCCLAADEVAVREMAGTLEYMAPECLRKQRQSYRSDIWSLGIFVYELYHGKEPFKGKSKDQLLEAIYQSNCVFAPDIPNDVVDVFELCVRYDQAQRPSVTDLLQARYFDFAKPSRGAADPRILEVSQQSNILKPASQRVLNRIVSRSIPKVLCEQPSIGNTAFIQPNQNQLHALFEAPRKEVLVQRSFCVENRPEDSTTTRTTAGQRIYYQTQSNLRSQSTGNIREEVLPPRPPAPAQPEVLLKVEQPKNQEALPAQLLQNLIPRSYPKFSSHSLSTMMAPFASSSNLNPTRDPKANFKQNHPTAHADPKPAMSGSYFLAKSASPAIFSFVPGQDEQIRARLASKYLLPHYSYYLSNNPGQFPRDRHETSRKGSPQSQIETSLQTGSPVQDKPALKLKLAPKTFKSEIKPRSSALKVYEDYRSGKNSISQISREPAPPSRALLSNSNSEHELAALISQLEDPKNNPIYLKYLTSRQPGDPGPPSDPKLAAADKMHLHTQETTACDEHENLTASLQLLEQAKSVAETTGPQLLANKKPQLMQEARDLTQRRGPQNSVGQPPASTGRDSKRPSLTLRPKGSSNNNSFVASERPAPRDSSASKEPPEQPPVKRLLLRASSPQALDRSAQASSTELR